MRLGWTTSKYSTTYRAVKTIRSNGKNKTEIMKSFGSEKQICETYGVTDAKAWAKEQPTFGLHDVYRSLSAIAEELDYMQSRPLPIVEMGMFMESSSP